MKIELGGSGTRFGYTDPDLYEFELDGVYSATLAAGLEPLEAATVLIGLKLADQEDTEDE